MQQPFLFLRTTKPSLVSEQMMADKKLNIGLRQAPQLCQMSFENRLEFLSEGLPIILDSAQGFWDASCQLKDKHREAEVLKGFAMEEAAKILILMDSVRCPKNLIPSKIGKIIKWFYDHLARLIYADAASWKPTDTAELRDYIEPHRKAHYLEGSFGEYILPNSTIFTRESRLYADIEAYEDAKPSWNKPRDRISCIPSSTPHALKISEAMSNLGIFSPQGLKITAEIWGQVNFSDTENYSDAVHLARQQCEQLITYNLPKDSATDSDISDLVNDWQLPMYNFDLSPIHISLEELKKEQDRMLIAEIGNDDY